MDHHFYLKEWLTNYVIHVGYLADISSKLKKKMSLSLQGKQLTVFDKIWAFGQKLEFWKIFTYHWELDSFLILKGFSGKVSGDTENCGF